MRQHLGQVAHVEPRVAARALHEMIGLCFGDAIGVGARLSYRTIRLCELSIPLLTGPVVGIAQPRGNAGGSV